MISNLKLAYDWWKTWGTPPVFDWIKAASCYRARSFELASKHYLRGLEKHREHPAAICARLDLAFCYFKLRRLEEAERHLRFVTNIAPNTREAYLRLARLQLWSGHSLEAAWTMRRAIRAVGSNPELVATFLIALLDNGGPEYLLEEACEELTNLSFEERRDPLVQTAQGMLLLYGGKTESGMQQLAEVVAGKDASFEAVLVYAEQLLVQGDVARARQQLRRALAVAPEFPRLLSLLAESYLKDGPFFNADYALQLATAACQSSAWLSPRELHVLAESYRATGDKMSALIMAGKARQAGNRLMGSYSRKDSLESLISALSTGTLA